MRCRSSFCQGCRKEKTHQLLKLLATKPRDVVLGAIREAEHVGLNDGLAVPAVGLLDRARLVVGALAVQEPVTAARAVAARRVRQTDAASTGRVALAREVAAAAAGGGRGADAPVGWDLCLLALDIFAKGERTGGFTYGNHSHARAAAVERAAHPGVDVAAAPVASVAVVVEVTPDVDGGSGGRESKEDRGELHV